MLDYAINALKHGLCVMPAMSDGSKQPIGNSVHDRRWKHFQSQLPTDDIVKKWYESGITNIGYITGKVSGNLEVMDFDDADAYHEYKTAAASSGLGDIVSRIESAYLEHSPKGVHWFYRCEEISGNLKLASREKRQEEKQHERDKVQVMIETRGEGGYIIAAPSYGPVNPKGEYKLICGDVGSIATITPAERNELHHLARAFDKMPKSIEYSEINDYRDSSGKRPGDDFSEQVSWDDILVPHGWKRCFCNGDETFWTRPGKNHGISATTNYAGSGLFYVFSSSTDFEPNRGFSKFAVWTYLNYGGDFSHAASALSGEGYGDKQVINHVEERSLKLKTKSVSSSCDVEIDPYVIPAKLMDIPGIVNDLQSWFNSCAIRSQPTFAFAASLAFSGLLMSRRVQTHTGLRTNLMIISLGDSASGKNETRNCIRNALIETDNKHLIGAETIGSEAGLLDELAANGGQAIYQLDEIGHALMAMTGKRAAGYLSSILPTLMKLQSSAGQTWIGRSLKQSKDNKGRSDIEDPCVVIYATSVPDKYFQAIDYTNIEDGFVPRFLIFQTSDPFPKTNYGISDNKIIPDAIRDHIYAWTQEKSRLIRRSTVHEPKRVRHTEETMVVMRHFETIVQDKYRKNRNKRLHAIWGRAQATAEQLALLFTCSQNPDADFIDPIMAAKACMLTQHLCDQQMIRLDRHVSSNDHESDVKSVINAITDSKIEGISKSDLIKKMQRIPAKRLSDITIMLIESEQVLAVRKRVGDSRKTSTVYFSTQYATSEVE